MSFADYTDHRSEPVAVEPPEENWHATHTAVYFESYSPLTIAMARVRTQHAMRWYRVRQLPVSFGALKRIHHEHLEAASAERYRLRSREDNGRLAAENLDVFCQPMGGEAAAPADGKDGGVAVNDNDTLAEQAAVELLGVLETPITGTPSVKVIRREYAIRIIKSALLGTFEAAKGGA